MGWCRGVSEKICWSEYKIGKAKANASQVIPELVKTATNIVFRENSDDKHNKDAKFGWYRCTVRFTLPKALPYCHEDIIIRLDVGVDLNFR